MTKRDDGAATPRRPRRGQPINRWAQAALKESLAQSGWNRGIARVAAHALAASLLLAAAPRAGYAADPDVLRKIVHDICVPGLQEHGDPKPCALVDVSHGVGSGYAVLRDVNGVAQFLLIPTERITGIEDPALLAPNTPNFFDAAWSARTFVETQLRRAMPRDAFGLVVNSVQGRSQEQLHIHIDCIRADVRDALRLRSGEVGPVWAPFPAPLLGRGYMAMRVPGERLGSSDPFKLLASGVPGAQGGMGLHTLIVAGVEVEGRPEFVILDRQVTKEVGDRGNGTELLDRACGLAETTAP